jgi:glyoxylase-like metal-dependent hydrolase (beta-lactamase superfamily II)
MGISHIDTNDLLIILDRPGSWMLVDVRSREEFAEWNIPVAVNIPLEDVELHLDDLRGRDLYLICAKGPRSERVADLLDSHGLSSIVVDGGMESWANTYDTVSLDLGTVRIVQLRRRGKGCLSYVIGSGSACVVLDPPRDTSHSEAIARANGWGITVVADTHMHADHVSGAVTLAQRHNAMLVLNERDDYTIDAGTPFQGALDIGGKAPFRLDRLATPGHTMGSSTYALGQAALFTGDTLFVNNVGRPDLADNAMVFAQELYDSLHQQILSFPASTLLFPAHVSQDIEIHGDVMVTTTLGDALETIPALSMNRQQFVATTAGRAVPRPPNAEVIVAANREGGLLPLDEVLGLETGPNRCAAATSIAS